MSLQLVLAGLYPPSRTSLEWNKDLNWQPIPFSYEDLDKDSLLLVRNPCPRYFEELERVMKEDLAQTFIDNAKLFEELSNVTGLSIKTPDDIQSLYSTLKAEVSSTATTRNFLFSSKFSFIARVRSETSFLDDKVFSSKATRLDRQKLCFQCLQQRTKTT
jgi:hypothetical protein